MITTRIAEEKDAPQLVNLFLQLGYSTSTIKLATLLKDNDAFRKTLVAEAEGKINGVIVFHFLLPIHEDNAWCVISALVVDESARGAGVGERLLAQAEQQAGSMGCSQIELSSSERRERAHQFYQKNGYQEVRKRFVKKLIVE